MKGSITFIASSAAEALTRINEELGPDAIVLSVREIPRNGLGRWWGKPRIEVVAHARVKPVDELIDVEGRLGEALEMIRRLNRYSPPMDWRHAVRESPSVCPSVSLPMREPGSPLEQWLMDWGLAGCWSRKVAERAEAMLSDCATGEDERRCAREILQGWWRRSEAKDSRGVHLFVGATGCGKTTVLGKWMAQAALLAEQRVRVWRLGGARTNTAESLSMDAELLGIPVERNWRCPAAEAGMDVGFVDLPGIDWRDGDALGQFKACLEALGDTRVHLVLNAAYDGALMLEQIEAFSCLNPDDLIFTHMDEERRFGKLWNCVLETRYAIGSLSFGPHVPGTLRVAEASQLLPGGMP